MKKFICSIYLKTKNLILSIKQYNQIHLGDSVIYDGKKCFVNNGTRISDDGVQLWDVLEEKWNSDGTRNKYYVPSNELKKCLTWFNIKNSLLSHYSWWKEYWYDIDLRKILND